MLGAGIIAYLMWSKTKITNVEYKRLNNTIRTTVTWNAVVKKEEIHDFAVVTSYGINKDNTHENFIIKGKSDPVWIKTGTAKDIITNVDYVIDLPPGTYDSYTLLTEVYLKDGGWVYKDRDWVIEDNVLIVS